MLPFLCELQPQLKSHGMITFAVTHHRVSVLLLFLHFELLTSSTLVSLETDSRAVCAENHGQQDGEVL